jgi:nucleoside-diphosphate-sugar epimerase
MAVIVVTGASGLIGRAVARRLAAHHLVFALSRRPDDAIDGARPITADLTDPGFVATLPRCADAVVHLAQAARYDEFPDAAGDVLGVNVAALVHLLDWARGAGVGTFVHASTGGLYGRSGAPLCETAPLRIAGPLSFYFRTKQCAELLVNEYRQFFDVVTLRPFFVYGGAQRPQMLLPRLVSSIRQRRPIRLAGPEGMRLNPLHVSDMAAAVETALTLGRSEVFNVAGPEVLSIRAIAEVLAAAIGEPAVYEFIPELPDSDIIADTARLRETGWVPCIRLAQAAVELCRAPCRPAGDNAAAVAANRAPL